MNWNLCNQWEYGFTGCLQKNPYREIIFYIDVIVFIKIYEYTELNGVKPELYYTRNKLTKRQNSTSAFMHF